MVTVRCKTAPWASTGSEKRGRKRAKGTAGIEAHRLREKKTRGDLLSELWHKLRDRLLGRRKGRRGSRSDVIVGGVRGIYGRPAFPQLLPSLRRCTSEQGYA